MTEKGEIHQMSLLVGGLKNAVETMTRLWQSQEVAATEGRRQLHLKFDSLKDEVRTLTGRVDQMGKDIALIEPSVKGFNDEKLRDEGAKRLGKTIIAIGGTAITAVAGAVGYGIHELIGYLRH
jgi:hypothetical protein